jgi:hypothetical protein
MACRGYRGQKTLADKGADLARTFPGATVLRMLSASLPVPHTRSTKVGTA